MLEISVELGRADAWIVGNSDLATLHDDLRWTVFTDRVVELLGES